MGVHVARAAFSIMGTLCFVYALQGMATADAAAISYLQSLIVFFIGYLFFKEKLNTSKVIFIICGLSAAMLIMKPGFQKFSYYYIFMFFALLFWSGNSITIKVLGKTEKSKGQLFYVNLFSSMMALPLALEVWQPIEIWYWKYILALAVFYLLHSICIFKAFKYADISTVMPFDYTRLIFTALLGYTIFTEVPDKYSILGYCLIAFGGIYFIHDKAKEHSRKKKIAKGV
jgi:S-adenosylmethionine uptake transporter